MDSSTFRKSEQLSLELSKLYEQYGYHKFYMNKLEEYAFYMDNLNFLQSREIIVFSDLNGKLMALKPDITLSIVKNTKAEQSSLDKLYYTENVFRAAKNAREYRELRQMGLECIGNVTPYAITEALTLAAKSLAVIDPEYTLCISHLGVVSGLLSSLSVDYSVKQALLGCIREKNPHDMVPIAQA
ncbi:MAG: ATP phosphoribosyltransferase regulatory subunit, partial [Eubacteriales bacterium]|nr:ATP phosphoribosyltransferase regulatory subunit [Eubacteriales bacterium]